MSNEVSSLSNGMSSYDTNVMLAALISLLLVILFVLLLHIYTKWFLSQAHQRRQSSSVSHVLRPSRFHDFHTLHFDDTTASNSTSKGLDASVIASIPLFVYKTNNIELEYCVICLSAFEEEEIGRDLPKCGHGFHVECIDMWLHSHTNCPICRASVVVNDDFKVETGDAVAEDSNTETVLVDFSSVDSEAIGNVMENNDSSTSSMSSLGNSLKSMLSRNSSEHKVYVSNVE